MTERGFEFKNWPVWKDEIAHWEAMYAQQSLYLWIAQAKPPIETEVIERIVAQIPGHLRNRYDAPWPGIRMQWGRGWGKATVHEFLERHRTEYEGRWLDD